MANLETRIADLLLASRTKEHLADERNSLNHQPSALNSPIYTIGGTASELLASSNRLYMTFMSVLTLMLTLLISILIIGCASPGEHSHRLEDSHGFYPTPAYRVGQ